MLNRIPGVVIWNETKIFKIVIYLCFNYNLESFKILRFSLKKCEIDTYFTKYIHRKNIIRDSE